MKKIVFISIQLVVFFWLNSCKTLQPYLSQYAPDILFKFAKLKGIDMGGVDLDFTFSAKNKVPIPINFSSIASQIYVDGKKLFNSNIPKGIQLKANGTSDFTFSPRVEFKDISRDLLEVFRKDTINVKVDGLAKFAMGQFGDANVPIDASKVVPVPKLPEIKFGSFKQKRTSTNIFNPEAIFDLNFTIANPNAFGVDLNFIDYSFAAENLKLIDGKAPALKLASKGSKSYTIPVRLRGSDMLNLVPKLRNFSSLNYQFKSKLNVNAGSIPFDLPYSYP